MSGNEHKSDVLDARQYRVSAVGAPWRRSFQVPLRWGWASAAVRDPPHFGRGGRPTAATRQHRHHEPLPASEISEAIAAAKAARSQCGAPTFNLPVSLRPAPRRLPIICETRELLSGGSRS